MVEEETSMKLYKNVFILLLVLAILGGTYYFVKKIQPKEENKTETITIFKTEKDNISEIIIQTKDSELVLYKSGDEWKVKADYEIKLNKSKVESLVYDVATINADQIVEENPQDLSKYGLDSPTSIVTVKLTDNTTKVFYVGDKTPTKTAYYFKDKDVNTVYTVYSGKGDSLSSTLDDYRDTTMFTMKQEDIVSFTIEGKSRKRLVVKAKAEGEKDQESSLSGWTIVEPFNKNGDNENISKLVLEKISQITAKEIVEDNPTDLSKYGLSSPNYTIQFTDKDNNTVKLFLGNTNGENTYVKVEGNNAVFNVASSALEFKDVEPFQLIEKFAFITNIDGVSKIVIHSPGKQTTLEIIKNGEESEYKVNGQKAAESPFKKAYQEVIGLIVDGMVTEQVQGTPEVSYTFYFNDGSPEVTVEYVSMNDRNYAVFKNGKCDFYILKKKVNQMLEKIKAFEENPLEEK